MSDQLKLLVEKYQCPGCASGIDTSGPCYKPNDSDNKSCQNHAAGTIITGVSSINLGMPKGFMRIGSVQAEKSKETNIRIFEDLPKIYPYNELNVPVWAMEHDGNLIVRCYMPRLNNSSVDVIPDKKISDLPEPFCKTVIDVSALDQENWMC